MTGRWSLVENLGLLRNLRILIELRGHCAHGSRLEIAQASFTICRLLGGLRIGQKVLQGHGGRCLAEPTSNNAVSAGGPVRVGHVYTTLLVVVDVNGIENAFDCVVWPDRVGFRFGEAGNRRCVILVLRYATAFSALSLTDVLDGVGLLVLILLRVRSQRML